MAPELDESGGADSGTEDSGDASGITDDEGADPEEIDEVVPEGPADEPEATLNS